MNAPATDQLPVVIVGAGPIGLAAAAHLIERGLEPLVLEAGPSAGTEVRAWAHVRLFSPWAEVTDALPETGVFGGAGLFDDSDAALASEGGGCCAAPATLQIGIGAPAAASGGC